MKYQRFRGRRVRKRETAYKTNGILTKHQNNQYFNGGNQHHKKNVCAYVLGGNWGGHDGTNTAPKIVQILMAETTC